MSTQIDTAVDDVAAQATSMLGRRYQLTDHYDVGREKIKEFAAAVQDSHPAHYQEADANSLGHSALVAPLTFTAILGGIAQQRVFAQFLRYDLSQVLHTDQRIQVHRPVYAGDSLNCQIALASFRQGHGQDSFVFETDLVDGDGASVQTSWTTAVARTGGEIDQNLARAAETVMMSRAAPPDRVVPVPGDGSAPPRAVAEGYVPRPQRAYSDVRVGDELPTEVYRLSRGDLVNYAGVAGDRNPIHWSDHIAGLVGLDKVVAHGMLTMGIGASYLTSLLGDPGAVADYGVRFSSPVFVGSDEPATIEIASKVKAVDDDARTATIALRATAAGKRIFGRAEATVHLA
ncbi:MAG: MaoC family dehydratase N-terminal domain-containing protein [Aldersonia sp.]|nr:MaoC family dehydratase N-terminal domain-containing protein [Aldersonia sp.]